MIPRLVTPLRVLLVLLFAGILAVQGLMMATVIHEATEGGDAALPIPALILPIPALILPVLALVGVVLLLLIVVMRALLKQAVHLHTETEGVI